MPTIHGRATGAADRTIPVIRVMDVNGELRAKSLMRKTPLRCSRAGAATAASCLPGNVKTVGMTIWRSEADGTGLRRITEGNGINSPSAHRMENPFLRGSNGRFCVHEGSQSMAARRNGFPGIRGPAGYDIARDGKMAVLGTYDFKAQKPNISLVLLIPENLAHLRV